MYSEVVENDRGRRALIKRAETPTDATRLRREADLLEVATHPALVELLAFEDGPEPVLQTAFVGPSLAAGRALDIDEVAGVAAAAASTLADLHEMGLVHGGVAVDHVLLDDDGRPVLCSLGSGGLIGERAPASGPEGAGGELDPAIDVFGLGVVLAALLARANGRARTAAGETLRRLADAAMAATASERPSARHLADAIHDAVPGARLPQAAPSVPPAPPGRAAPDDGGGLRPLEAWRRSQASAGLGGHRRRRLSAVVGTLVAVAGAGVGILIVVGRPVSTAAQSPPGPEAAAAGPASTTAATATSVAPTSVAPVTTLARPTTTVTMGAVTTLAPPVRVPVSSRTDCPPVGGPLSADVDGDGCADSIRYVAGVVEAAGKRWAVGEADDVVAVGDWSCSGVRSLAVLRPRTGEVFTFDGWAGPGHDVQAPLLATVAGAQAVRAADLDADGCNELLVERSSGAPAVLRVPRVPRVRP